MDQRQVRGGRESGRYRAERGKRCPLRGSFTWALLLALTLLPQPTTAAPGCKVTVSADLTFGSYDVYSPAPLTTTGRVRLSCPASTNPQITLSSGGSASFVWRELRSTTGALRYNVYMDAAMSLVWGDGTDGSSVFTAPSGKEQVVLYGRIPAGQDPTAGDYADSLQLTLYL